MSEINANIVVEPIDLNVTQSSINQNITLEPITLGLFTTAPVSAPAAPDGALQYRANNTTFGGLANAIVSSGTLTFTNLANLSIDGGLNAYYLQTDGAGTLSWAAGGTPTGSGVPSGANTLIQLSDGSGSFDSGPGFSFDNVSNVFSAPGNVNVLGDINGSGDINGAGGVFTYVSGDGANLTAIAGANITGEVAFAAVANSVAGANIVGAEPVANVAGTVTTAAQPNITSVGTLTSIEVSGTTSIQEAIEKVTINAGGAVGTMNYDILDGAILYYTGAAAGNFVLNLRGNATTTLNTVMDIGESMTFSFMNTNAGIVYYLTGLEIEGTTRTIEWIDGTAATTGT